MDTFITRIEVVTFILFFVTLAGVTGVHINDLKIPPIIVNGTEYVTLDCDYTLSENEKPGLVVKWYFNNEESPVYQWIPNQRPQDLGILRGKLNLEYQASPDAYKMYRALQIQRPYTNLSGKYLCRVSTLFNDAYKSGTMLVYSPQRDMGIKVTGTRVPGFVNVSCWASGVFPEPRLTLYYGESADQKVEDLVIETKLILGAYDIRGYKIMKETNLSSISSFFECELTIPNTEYIVRKGTVYEPGSLELRDGSMAGGVGSPKEFPGAFPILLSFGVVLLSREKVVMVKDCWSSFELL